MEKGYMGRVWSRFQSFMFVAACAVAISYGLTHMSVVGLAPVQEQATKAETKASSALAAVNQVEHQSAATDAKAQAAQEAATKAQEEAKQAATERAARQKFRNEKYDAKFEDLYKRNMELRESQSVLQKQFDEFRAGRQ